MGAARARAGSLALRRAPAGRFAAHDEVAVLPVAPGLLRRSSPPARRAPALQILRGVDVLFVGEEVLVVDDHALLAEPDPVRPPADQPDQQIQRHAHSQQHDQQLQPVVRQKLQRRKPAGQVEQAQHPAGQALEPAQHRVDDRIGISCLRHERGILLLFKRTIPPSPHSA